MEKARILFISTLLVWAKKSLKQQVAQSPWQHMLTHSTSNEMQHLAGHHALHVQQLRNTTVLPPGRCYLNSKQLKWPVISGKQTNHLMFECSNTGNHPEGQKWPKVIPWFLPPSFPSAPWSCRKLLLCPWASPPWRQLTGSGSAPEQTPYWLSENSARAKDECITPWHVGELTQKLGSNAEGCIQTSTLVKQVSCLCMLSVTCCRKGP